jgi:cell division septum initiation protein DivIVA
MEQTERAAKHGGECRLPEKRQQRQQLRETIQKQLKQLEEKQWDHLQPKDEDGRVMKCRNAGNKFAYNAQAVVEQNRGLIVAGDGCCRCE